MIREANENDLNELLQLYLHLHETSVPENDDHLAAVWSKIMSDDNYHLIVAEEDGRLVSSCTCIIVPNLTRGVSPYAFVENVVTHKEYRGKGFASACLDYAKQIAINAGCYKMMLITGSSNPKTHDFYKNAGYSAEGKTAYYQMLKEVNWNKL